VDIVRVASGRSSHVATTHRKPYPFAVEQDREAHEGGRIVGRRVADSARAAFGIRMGRGWLSGRGAKGQG